MRAGDRLSRRSPAPAWARFAHALARTDRVSDGLGACERALELGDDPEVAGCWRTCASARRASSRDRSAAA